MADTETDLPPIPAQPAQTELNPWDPGWAESLTPPAAGPLPPKADTAVVSGAKAAATGVVPAGGALAGAEVGATIGAAVPVLGETGISELVGGFIGAIVGSVTASKAQKKVLDKAAPEFQKQLAVDEEAHPIASTIGDIASSLPAFELNPGQTVRGVSALWKMSQGAVVNKVEKEAAFALAVQSGMGAGGAVVTPLIEGQNPNLKDIGISTLTAMIFGKPRFNFFKVADTLNLPKPATAEGGEANTPASGAGGTVPAPTSPVPPPENTYAPPPLPQERQAAIADIATREVNNPTDLTPKDWSTLGSLTDNQHPEFHPDANGFYLQAKAAAKQAKAKAAATEMAKQELVHGGAEEDLPPDQRATSKANNDPGNAGWDSLKKTAAAAPAPVAAQVAAARAEVEPAPTQAQKEAGNYKKGHVTLDGLDIAIENPAGGERSGVDKNGQKWSVKMPVDYGYIKKTEGADGDHVDVFIGPNPDKFQKVWVVDQVDPEGKFDETKSLVGFDTKEQALDAYRKSFSDGKADQRIGGVTEMTRDQFKEWVTKGDHSKPLFKAPPKPVAPAEPERPAWQKLTGNDDDLSRMIEEGNEAQVKRQKVEGNTQGKKRAQAFEETSDPDVIYTDTRAGKNRSESRKLVAMQSPDGSHVMVSTAYESPTGGKLIRRVTGYDKSGKPVARKFDDLIAEGWKPLATAKTKNATQGHVATYSPEVWAKMASDERQKVAASQRTAEAMQGHIEAGKEFGLENPEARGEEPKAPALTSDEGATAERPAGEEVEAPDRIEQFTPEHAEAVHDAIHADGVESPKDVMASIQDHGLVLEFEAALRQTGLLEQIKTPEDAARAAFFISKKIYDTYAATGENQHGFSQQLHKALLDESGEQAAGKAAKTVPGPASKPAGRPAKEAGSGKPKDAADAARSAADKQLATAKRAAESATADAEAELIRNREAHKVILASRPTPQYVAQTMRKVAASLRGLGVDVHLLHESVTAMAIDAAKYKEWKNVKGELARAITVSLADVHNPSLENLVALMHETGHAVFAREKPEMQALLHQAISQAADEALGLHNFVEKVSGKYKSESERAQIAQEGRLVEATARALVSRGFDPEAASGLIQRMSLALRAMYQGAVMAIAKAMRLPASPERAMAYMEHRVKLALSGSKGESIVSFLGGPRMTMPDWGDPNTIELIRNRDIRGTSDPLETSVSKDIHNPTLDKEPGVAAEMAVHDVLVDAVKAFNEEGHNPAGIEPADLLRRFGMPSEHYGPDELPITKVAAVNSNLKENGLATVDANTRIDTIKSLPVAKQAAAIGLRLLNAVKANWKAKRRESEAAIKRTTRELERIAEPLDKAVRDYTDIDLIAGQAAVRMRDAIREQREAQSQIPELSGKQSMLDQVLRQLDSDIKGNILSKPYADALNKLHDRLGGQRDVKFADMLERVAGLSLDWKAPATTLRDQIRMIDDPVLSELKDNTHDGRALMATAITFAKKNDYLMNLLQLRKSAAMEQRAQVNKALKVAISNQADAAKEAQALIEKLTTLKPLAKKLLENILELKERQYELIDERQRNQMFVDFHTLAEPIVTQAQRPLEARIGALHTDINIGPETDIRIPPYAEARPEMFTKKTLSLWVNGEGSTTPQPEVREALQKMGQWLDANRDKRARYGADYNEIEATYDKLSNYLTAFGAAEPIKQLWIAKFLAPTAEKLRLVNTPTSRAVAGMIENVNSLIRKYRNDATKHSHEWEVRRSAAMKALGITNAQYFKRSVTDVFKDYVAKNKDIRSGFADNTAATEASIKAGMKHLMEDPGTRSLFERDPKAGKAVEDFFRKTVEVNAWRAANGKAMGNKVYDPRLGLYRDVIGSEAYEFPRGVSDQAEQMFLEMGAWAKPMNPGTIAELHSKGDGEGLMAELAPRFNKRVWDGFVKWVAYKNGISQFAGPVKKDGTYDYASRDNVIKAYENAKGNPIAFAQDLFTLERGSELGANASEFVGDTMHSLQAQYNLLERMRADYSENNNHRVLPTPKRHIMDARLTDAGPREFYDYIDDDRASLGNLLRSQAYNSAFGRRLENYYQTIAAAEQEQAQLAQKYDVISQQFKDLSGRELRQAVLAEAKAQDLNVKALEQAHANLRTIRKAGREIQGFLSQNQSRPPELSVFSELMSGIGSLTVAGPGTAFIAHTIAFEQAIRKFGLNADGLGMMADTAKSTAGVALGGFLRTFGRSLAMDAEHIQALERNGLSNPNTIMKWEDQVRSTFVDPDYVHNVLGKGIVYTGRAMKLAANRLSAFHYLARVIQLGNSVAWAKKISSVVERGVEHFEENPQDMKDPKFQLTAKHLGVTEGRAFDYLNFAMGKYGLDIRQMVEDAMTRRTGGKNEPLLPDAVYRRIAQVSLDDMTLESSPTTRPAFLMNNSLGQLANPMLGWALHKTYDVTRSFREADGVRSLNGFKSATLAYAAILPLAMAAAFIRDKFDEDVAGRKIAVSDLSTIKTPEQAFMTVVDNAARVGTFGVMGEAFNEVVNKESGARPTTLDGRIFFVNTLHNFVNGIENLAHQRDFDYQTVVRPLIQSLGGNGFYQYAGIVNHTFALDNAESRIINRISVNNFLRVAGRENNLDVRTYAGMSQMASLPNPWRPAIGNMVMSAYANDAQGFNAARREAVQKLVEAGNTRADAEKKVIQAFEDSNPLRVVFKTTPTEQDYRKMLASMDDNGKVAVATAVRLFQHYATEIGANASMFGRGAKPQPQPLAATDKPLDSTLSSVLKRMQSQPITLDDVRRRALLSP